MPEPAEKWFYRRTDHRRHGAQYPPGARHPFQRPGLYPDRPKAGLSDQQRSRGLQGMRLWSGEIPGFQRLPGDRADQRFHAAHPLPGPLRGIQKSAGWARPFWNLGCLSSARKCTQSGIRLWLHPGAAGNQSEAGRHHSRRRCAGDRGAPRTQGTRTAPGADPCHQPDRTHHRRNAGNGHDLHGNARPRDRSEGCAYDDRRDRFPRRA